MAHLQEATMLDTWEQPWPHRREFGNSNMAEEGARQSLFGLSMVKGSDSKIWVSCSLVYSLSLPLRSLDY